MRIASILLAVAVSAAALHAEPVHEKVVHLDPGATRRHVAEGLALGGVALLAGSFGVAVFEKSRYEEAVRSGAAPAANHAVTLTRDISNPAFATGVLALGVAMYLEITMPEKHTIITPSVGPDHVGFAIGGSL